MPKKNLMRKGGVVAVSFEDFSYVKKQTITAAIELCYNSKVIEKLKKAKTSDELTRIMHDARNGLYD